MQEGPKDEGIQLNCKTVLEAPLCLKLIQPDTGFGERINGVEVRRSQAEISIENQIRSRRARVISCELRGGTERLARRWVYRVRSGDDWVLVAGCWVLSPSSRQPVSLTDAG
jgi:hypothetical protein